MFKRFLFAVLVVSLLPISFSESNDEKVKSAMKLPLKGFEVSFGGVVAGLEAWVKRNYKLCGDKNTIVCEHPRLGGDADKKTCYIFHGPDWDEDFESIIVGDWSIDVKIFEDPGNEKAFQEDFGYEFSFDGKQFVLKKFDFGTLKINSDKAKAMFLEIVNSREAKAFK
jgi:hypothetical protein